MARTLPIGRSSSNRPPVAMADRLSSLPDALLHGIMSFLPARHAVQTCVLSRRWEDLWCSMPCLNIDQQEFDMAASEDSDGLEYGSESSRFEEFVNSLLMFHKAPSLEMFRFHVTQPYKFGVVDRWFRRGIKCCPAVVEISISANATRFYRLPHLGTSACHLRRLHLVAISLDKTVMQHLSSACPVLEVLELDGCLLDPPEISSSTLKHLILKDYKSYGQVLMITAPALVSFYLVSNAVQWNWGGVSVNEMPTLVNATVCLKQDRRSNPPKVPCKILCSLMKVGNLELSGLDTLLALHEDSGIMPTFSNLRTLLFNACDLSDDFQMLGCFLNNTPSLEKLTLQYCKLPEGSKKRKRMENPKRISIKCHDTLTFQCPNLKLIEIKYKEEDVDQLLGLLSGIWRNLRKTTIMLTEA